MNTALDLPQWRAIPGYEGFYSAGDNGWIRAEERVVDGKCGSRRTLPQRLVHPSLDSNGYLQVSLHKFGRRTCRKVHTIIALTFLGPRPVGMQVAHYDGARTNNGSANLRYDTAIGNIADRARHGTNRRGSASARSKFNEDQVKAIRLDMRGVRAIGRAYGVHHKSISSIKNGQSWGWL